jgi:hypothetical protein
MYFCGEGNPSTGDQSTIQDQVNLHTALESNEECTQKEEFTSRNGKVNTKPSNSTICNGISSKF